MKGETREGRPCKRCETTSKYLSNGRCVGCTRAQNELKARTVEFKVYQREYRQRPDIRARRRADPQERLRQTKTNAKVRGLDFALTDEQALELFKQPCHYSGHMPDPLNGIDRWNNNAGYTPENSVACCFQCNDAKGSMDGDEFLKLVYGIASHRKDRTLMSWPYYGGRVILADRMGDDLTVVNAARISFDRRSEKLTDQDRKLIAYLASHKHMSPFRHLQFQLILEKVPEFVLRQVFKHQVGLAWTAGDFRESATVWNEVSGRYTEVDLDFFVPDAFRSQAKVNRQASGENLNVAVQDVAMKIYTEAMGEARTAYENLLRLGVAREQARMVIPLSFTTSVMWTGSLEGFVHFVRLRDHEGAQVETRELARIVHKACALVAPEATRALLEPMVE